MKMFETWIEGTSPILIHRFAEADEGASAGGPGKGTRRIHIKDVDPRETCERACYRTSKGIMGFPGAGPARLLREAGSAHKQRGSRKSLKYVVPAAVMILEELIPFYLPDRKTPITTFEVDGRPVTIPSTKGKVMRYRPRLNAWAMKIELRVNEDLLDPSIVRQLLTEGGMQQGLGDFRPSCGGPFGTFGVVLWDEVGVHVSGNGKATRATA
jgi:hypothetical protein